MVTATATAGRMAGTRIRARNGKQFAGWLYKKPRAVQQVAKELAKSRGYPTMWTQLQDEEVQDLYHELTALQPEPVGRDWGGNRNGD